MNSEFTQTGLEYAGFWRRFAAAFVDWAILGLPGIALFVLLIFFASDHGDKVQVPMLIKIIAVLAGILIPAIYFVSQESGPHSATWGKRLLCIKLQGPNKEKLNFARAVARYFAHWISAMTAIGYLIQPFTKKRQALHDLLTDSVVVTTNGGTKRKTLTVLLSVAGVVAYSICLPLLILVAVNWTDDPLQPDVGLALDWKSSPNAFNDNGYLVLLGQSAPESVDPYEAGRKALLAQFKLYAEKATDSEWHALSKQQTAPTNSSSKYICSYPKQNCVEHYLQTRSAMADVIKNAALQESRFSRIVHAKNFVEVQPPVYASPFPSWSYLTNAAELARTKAIYQIADGHPQEGIAGIVENAQFSRRMLQQSTTLIGHMLALGMIQKDMRIVSELVQKYPVLAQSHGPALLEILSPISGSEYSLKKAFSFEKTFLLNSVQREGISMPEHRLRNWASSFFYQPNATLNLMYIWPNEMEKMAELPAGKLDDEKSQAGKKFSDAVGYSYLDTISFKNPIGKVLVQVARSDYMKYIERQHDTDGYARLVALQLKIANEKIPAEKIAAAVNASAAQFRNPYTDMPMVWDAKASEIRFQGRQPSNLNINKSDLFAIKIASTNLAH